MPSDPAPPVEWIVERAEAGLRLDHFLSERTRISHAAARRVIEEGGVRYRGRLGRKGDRVEPGARVVVSAIIPTPEALRPLPDPTLPFEELYVDGDMVVGAKPPGQTSHPLRAGERGSYVCALLARHPECGGASEDPREAGLVHRLDIDTSGVLVAARSAASWERLRAAFSSGATNKEYYALVAGHVTAPGEVDLPLTEDSADRRKVRAVTDPYDDAAAQEARTRYAPIDSTHHGAADYTLLHVEIAVGRRHQIRAHLAALGNPIVGDALYGGPEALGGAPGHFLHAARVRFRPDLVVEAPLPEARAAALLALGLQLPRPARR